ncbi:hypothetical protein F5144DRAFT_654238 [Chaetomium tenue]|uniref:Uncharacterized protein n=1 Tax=Chaetomium tenue TaxID=1854479 RepID=A0ACB7P5I1_9PEZI|nr:hypothetical protein F5144DRAFT_654238 [Chaetomium globosum]
MARRKRDIFFHANFGLSHLLRLAERLRGRPCTCDDSQFPRSGALNWAIFLEFDDGVEWVFRAPCSRASSAATKDITGRLLASEVATLKYIREHTAIPVPEVFHYSPTYENDIGIPYILMSKATGHPLAKYEWPTHTHECSRSNSSTTARVMTGEMKQKVMRQLGCYTRQLFDLRFPTIGSLFEGGQGYYISECLSPGHVLEDRAAIEGIPRGPFHSEADYYSSLAIALCLHAEQLPLGHHVLRAPVPVPQEYPNFAKYYAATDRWNDLVALGGVVESSTNRLQYCLASDLLRDSIIPRMVRPVNQSAPGFPLYHHDLSLFATPGLPHPRDLLLDLSLVHAFRAGIEAENMTISGGKIEPNDWKASQMVSRFMRVVNLDALQDYDHLEALYTLAGGPATSGVDGDDTNSLSTTLARRATSHDALALASELAADDEPQSEISRREKEYFDAVGAQRLALARKVAFAAKMNPQFVADGRLWRWVDEVLEYHN